MASFYKRPHLTHFLCLPVSPFSPELRARFGDFKRSVLETCSADRGVEASIFQTPEKLHLTVTVMSLIDDADEKRAIECLTDSLDAVVRPILASGGGGPLRVSVAGLAYMNDDPTAVDVLYAKCTELTPTGEPAAAPSRLQRLCDELLRFFKTRGLVKTNWDSVRVHATLMNKQYRNGGRKESFDATNILARFSNFEFGVLELNELHLSLMGSKDSGSGFYQQVSKLPF